MPRVSVMLPVLNGMPYLPLAVESILHQTFGEFELIVIDDASTDDTPKYLDRLTDPRVRVIHNEQNLGVPRTLNKAARLAVGEYIARQDADDISLPQRLDLQVAFLEKHPEVGLLGTQGVFINDQGRDEGPFNVPLTALEISWLLLFENPFIHSSVMMRSSLLQEVGHYSESPDYSYAEDYELWSRMSRRAQLANLAGRLVRKRANRLSVGYRNVTGQHLQVERIAGENGQWVLGGSDFDPATWGAMKRFLFGPAGRQANFKSSEARSLLALLHTAHTEIARRSGAPQREVRQHRRALYRLAGRHAIALSYKCDQGRDLRCRFAFLAGGTNLVVKSIWPGN